MEDQPRINLWEKPTPTAYIIEEKSVCCSSWDLKEALEELRIRLDVSIESYSHYYQMFVRRNNATSTDR